MSPAFIMRASISLVMLLGGAVDGRADEGRWPPAYYEAHYRATVQHDHEGALTLFERVATDGDLSSAQQAVLRGEIAAAREAQLASSPARLHSADAIAFVEIHRPGELVERLTGMLGLETAAVLPELSGRKPRGPVDWENPSPLSFVPERLVVSPALVAWLKTFEGASFALTGLKGQDGDMRPEGALVLNTGGTELMRGLIEMAAQFGPLCESIGGYPTYAFPEGVVATLTHRLVIIGSSRDQIKPIIDRIAAGGRDSLAESNAFKKLAARRASATIFAYVNAAKAVAVASPHLKGEEEFQVAQALLDLDNLIGASLGIGAIDGGVGLDLSVQLNEGHHNLVYNLIRTPRMSRRSLGLVPPTAAAVIAAAINPPAGESGPTTDSKARTLKSVTGLDLMRELFGNMEEVALYVAPTVGGGLMGGGSDAAPPQVPNAGLVIAATDAGKSELLWKTLLSIPSKVMPKEAAQPESVTIAGQDVTMFRLPEVGAIYLASVNNCVVVTARRESLSAMFKAAKSGRSILKDEAMSGVLSRMSDDVGAVAMLHGGRLLQTAGSMLPALAGDDAPPPAVIQMMSGTLAKAFDTTVLYAGVTQSETEFNLRWCLAGLPNVNVLLSQLGPIMQTMGGMQSAHSKPRVAGRQARVDDASDDDAQNDRADSGEGDRERSRDAEGRRDDERPKRRTRRPQ